MLKRKDIISKILLALGIIVFLIPLVLNLYYKNENKAVIKEFRSQKVEQNSSKDNSKRENNNDSISNIITGKQSDTNDKQNSPIGIIFIPKIKEQIPIYKDIKGMLDINLDKGVVLLSRSTMMKDIDDDSFKEKENLSLDPKKTANMVLTGHRGTLNTNQNIFKNLDKLEKGDKFYIDNGINLLEFKVFEIKVIDPKQGNLIYSDQPFNQSTLVTCTPYLINNKRLIVSGGLSKITDNTDSEILNDISKNKNELGFFSLVNIMNLIIVIILIGLVIAFIFKKYKKRRL
ncbi:MAG: sortase [Finegoldia magna]|uniref:sortase n=1 Tax=Finegoldia magna TaxID=1260 RepID=UPI00290A1FF5|nr:sortase [Finegoldia magna]MDU5527615.1 sortase [Finegoldia magna]